MWNKPTKTLQYEQLENFGEISQNQKNKENTVTSKGTGKAKH
jgi:hypothetical protein